MMEKITETSILLFGKKGFSQTSIQDIVIELDVTKGTYYYYFPIKEQLLMDIHQDYITNLIERQELIVNDHTYSQQEKLTAIIRLLINDIADKGPSARVFSREVRHLGPQNMKIIKQDRDQFRLNIEAVIKEGIKQGEITTNLHEGEETEEGREY